MVVLLFRDLPFSINKSGLIKGMESLEEGQFVVFYYINTTEIYGIIKGMVLWWVWPYKRGGPLVVVAL